MSKNLGYRLPDYFYRRIQNPQSEAIKPQNRFGEKTRDQRNEYVSQKDVLKSMKRDDFQETQESGRVLQNLAPGNGPKKLSVLFLNPPS